MLLPLMGTPNHPSHTNITTPSWGCLLILPPFSPLYVLLMYLSLSTCFSTQKEGTNPGSITSSFGGVGRNIAECMSRLGSPPLFLSAIGKDYNGVMMCDGLAKCGLVRLIRSPLFESMLVTLSFICGTSL